MRLAACWAVTLLVGWGCQRDSNRIGSVDSESHWMAPCTSDAECGPLECLCGICTTPCDDAACGTLQGQCSQNALCAEAAAPACVSACEDDCAGDHLECVVGACVPRASIQPERDALAMDDGLPDAAMDAAVPDATPDAVMDMTPDAAMDMTPDAAPMDAVVDLGPDLALDMTPDMAPPPIVECGHPDSVCQADVTCGGDPCSALFPADPCVCVNDPPAPTTVACPGTGCCPGACGAEVCQAVGLDAQDALCGQLPMPDDNQCVAQQCTHDADCGAGRTCIRPGEWGHVRSACVIERCQQDSDCDAEPGGTCRGFFTACFVRGFACTYPSDPCRIDADCPQRGGARVCLPIEGGGTECVPVN